MTGTQVEINFHAGASNLLLNDAIVNVLVDKMNQVGAPQFSQAEKDFAGGIVGTFPPGANMLEGFGRLLGPQAAEIIANMQDIPLFEDVLPAFEDEITLPGSTDVGDVSWVTPTGQFMATCYAFGTPGHSWQLVAQGGMSVGHKGMLFAAKVLALSAAEFMTNAEALAKAKAEFETRKQGNPYISPIPDGVAPPV
jgi:aminobenzoyl-glutamate utilization protein B